MKSFEENIKLISEFMGDYNFEHTEGGLPIGDFSNSWDWLMPVVDKIEQVHEGVPQELINVSLFSTIDEVYKAVVEFINQYNKTK